MASNARFGKWSKTEKVYGDVDGGFPLVVFDSKMMSAVVLSPLTSFMSAIQTSFTSEKTGDTMLTFGPFSTITEVRVGVHYSETSDKGHSKKGQTSHKPAVPCSIQTDVRKRTTSLQRIKCWVPTHMEVSL